MRLASPKRLFLRFRKRGDAAALGKLFDLVAPELLAIATHITRDVASAEDAVQDTFLVAVENADRYDPSRPLVPWLVGILVNRAKKSRERSAIRSSRERETLDVELAAASPVPSDAAASEEVVALVTDAIETLQEPYRSVVREHLSDGRPPREIAQDLGRPAGTIRVQLHRGLDQLRQALASKAPGQGVPERLFALGLALPAAVKLERAGHGARGLDAVRRVVMAEASKVAVAAPVVIALTTAQVAMATASMATVGALAWQFLPSGGGAVDTGVGERIEPVTAEAAPSSDPTLAPVAELDRRDRGRAPRVEESSDRSRRPARIAASDKKKSKEREKRRKENEEDELEKFPFRVRPRVNHVDVPEADPMARFSASVVTRGYEQLGSASGWMPDGAVVPFGEFAGAHELPDSLWVRVDHPDAMPTYEELYPGHFLSEGDGYTAQPSVMLRPIKSRVHVPTQIEGRYRRPRGGIGPLKRFEGRVLLVNIDDHGTPFVIDEARARKGEVVSLRAENLRGANYVMAIPRSEDEAGDLEVVDVPREGELTLDEPIMGMRAPALSLRIVDAFSRPYGEAKLRGVVTPDVTTHFDTANDAPTEIDGWVFVDLSKVGEMADFLAASTSGEKKYEQIARKTVAATASSKGNVELEGAIPGIHELFLTTEIGGTIPIDFTIASWARSGDEVVAPDAGLELIRPPEIESPADWKSSTVTVLADGGEINGTIDEFGICQMNVPPDTRLNVTVQTKAGDVFEVRLGGLRASTRRAVLPRPVKR